jgi:hypothetical protein
MSAPHRKSRRRRGYKNNRQQVRGVRVGVEPQPGGASLVSFRIALTLDDARGRPASAVSDMIEVERERVAMATRAEQQGTKPPTDTEVLRSVAARLTGKESLLNAIRAAVATKRFPRTDGEAKFRLLRQVEKELPNCGGVSVRAAVACFEAMFASLKARLRDLRRGELPWPSSSYLLGLREELVPCDVCGEPLPYFLAAQRGLAEPSNAPLPQWVHSGYSCGLHQVEVDNLHRKKIGLAPLLAS